MKPSRSSSTNHFLKRQLGFTLLEVLVAFVLLSLTLGVILQIFSSGLHNVSAAKKYAQAAMLADSKLATVGTLIPLEEGEQSGEDNTFRWHMTIQPYLDPDQPPLPADNGYQLFSVVIDVRWQQGVQEPELRFSTLRLGSMHEQ